MAAEAPDLVALIEELEQISSEASTGRVGYNAARYPYTVFRDGNVVMAHCNGFEGVPDNPLTRRANAKLIYTLLKNYETILSALRMKASLRIGEVGVVSMKEH